MLSRGRQRLADAIVRAYPRAWRERYGTELADLVTARDLTRRELIDLARSALDEWNRPAEDLRGLRLLSAAGLRLLCAVCIAYLVAVVVGMTTQVAFLSYVAVVRWWIGADVLELLEVFDPPGLRFAAMFGYGLLAASPAVAFSLVTGVGRRWPVAARVLTTACFMSFTAWLVGPYRMEDGLFLANAAVTGWVLSTILFPARRCARTSLPALDT